MRTQLAIGSLFVVGLAVGLMWPLMASANHAEPAFPLTAATVQALSACNGSAGTAIPTGTFGNATTPPDRNNTSSSNEWTPGTVADLVIHANAESDPKESTLDISGSHNVLDGLVNSRSHLKIGGSWNQLRHGTDYGQRSVSGKVAFDLTGSNNCFSPEATQTYENAPPASPAGFPFKDDFDPDEDGNVLEHFAPGTAAANAAMADPAPGAQYFVCGIPDPDGAANNAATAPGCSGSGASAIMDRNVQGQTLEKGLYFVTGKVKISASNTKATLTIVSGQQLNVNGSFQGEGVNVFSPYTDASGAIIGGLLFASQWDEAAVLTGAPNGRTFPDGGTANDSPNSDRAEDALKIEGSLSRFEGIIVATNGRTELAGEQNQFRCPVMGDRVRLNGSKLYFKGAGCVANPGIQIAKTPDGGVTVNAGGNATFTITVTNSGAGPATNLDIDDVLPGSGWTIDPAVAGCAISGGNTLHCDIATLAAGASVTVVLTRATTVADCAGDTGTGVILDNGSLTADTGDDARAAADNNPAVTDPGHLLVRCPDVSVAKTPDEPDNNINAGEDATFTITFTNNGPGTATGVGTKPPHDSLPGNLAWTESGGDPDGKCSVTAGVLQCAGITLAANASYSVSVTAPTTAAACGQLDNTVTLVADGDTNSNNNANAGEIDVLCPTLAVDKTPDGGVTVNAGGDATFTITVTNSGLGTAKNVDIDDDLPGTGWLLVSGPSGCSISDGGTLHCDIPELAPGGSVTVVVKRATTAADCAGDTGTGVILDNGSLTEDKADDALADADNNAQVNDPGYLVVRCPDVSVAKTPDEPDNNINAGENATFTITFTNNGPGTATGVGTKPPHDSLPGGLAWTESGGDPDGKCSVTAGVLQCAGITLAANASYSVSVTAPTTAAACGQLDNTVTLVADGDTNSNNNANAGEIDVLCPTLAVDKTPDGGVTVNAGGDATFTITVTNNGAGTAKNVDIDDELPGSGWSIVSGPAGCAIGGVDNNKLHCDVAELASGASVTVVVKRATTAADCAGDTGTGVILDNGSLTADESDDALADADNSAQVNDPGYLLVRCPDVSVQKTPDPFDNDVNAGSTATFTITFTNNGPGTATGVGTKAPDHDVLPAGLTWTESGGDTDGKCSIEDNVLKCEGITLAPNTSYAVSVSATTDAADCGTLHNTVTLVADGDTDPTNNTDPGEIDVICPDVTVVKTPDEPNNNVNVGSAASFSITFINLGPGPATGVGTNPPSHDVLPAGLTWSESSDPAEKCSVVANVLECSGIELAAPNAGATDEYTVSVTAVTSSANCGPLDNTVVVTADGDTNATNNSDSAEIDVVCGALQITKTAKHVNPSAGPPNLVATFTVVDALGDSHELTTNADGFACVDGLALGETRSIIETTVPAGYEAPSIDNVTVVAGSCDGPLATGGVVVPVENMPLTDITIGVDSQVPGATSTTVSCEDSATPKTPDFTFITEPDGDGSFSMPNIPVPPNVTLVCTIVVDP